MIMGSGHLAGYDLLLCVYGPSFSSTESPRFLYRKELSVSSSFAAFSGDCCLVVSAHLPPAGSASALACRRTDFDAQKTPDDDVERRVIFDQ